MSLETIEKSMRTAIASLEMEGFDVDDMCIDLCRQMLMGDITMEEYLTRVIPRGAQ